MSDARSITADALEILVTRELRKAGIEPIGLRRRPAVSVSGKEEFVFDLFGRLEAYGRRWSVLIECRNVAAPVEAAEIDALRQRADASPAASAILCTVAHVSGDALQRARAHMIPVLRVVDARTALHAAGMIEGGQLPAWVPEFTVEIVTGDGSARILEAGQPEMLLREMRGSRGS